MVMMDHSDHVLCDKDHKLLTGTISDEEEEEQLSAYSTASSVRDVMAGCRATRDKLRKSRASLQALLEESRQTIEDAHQLRKALFLMINRRDKTYPLEESDHVSEAGSEPSATISELSDLTPDIDH